MSYHVPSGESICVTYLDRSGNEVYLTTTKAATSQFYLYQINDSELIKLGKDPSPLKLEEKFGVIDRILK